LPYNHDHSGYILWWIGFALPVSRPPGKMRRISAVIELNP
jgi:hypothetical protein